MIKRIKMLYHGIEIIMDLLYMMGGTRVQYGISVLGGVRPRADFNLKEQQSKRDLEVSNYFEKKRKIEELEYDIKRIEKEIQYDKAMIQDYENLYKQNAYDVEMLRRKDIERILRELDIHSLEKKKSENLIENYSIIVENLKNNGNKLKQKEVKVLLIDVVI